MPRLTLFAVAVLAFSTVEGRAEGMARPAGAGGEEVARLQERILALEARNERVEKVARAAGSATVLVLFTNAILCGLWAIGSRRNFWAWYLAGLFTGPLAGGVMLYKKAQDVSGEVRPGGAWGSVAGIVIPLGGFLVLMWLMGG